MVLFPFQSTVSFKVAVPKVADKAEWKLNGQIINLSLPLTDSVSCDRTSILWCIYIRAKANVKAMSLPICCIVSYLYVYTTAMSKRQKIKENYRFRFHFQSTIKRARRREVTGRNIV